MKSMHLHNSQLWPSVLYCGPVVVKFLVGPKGRSVKIESYGDQPAVPRHKRLPPPRSKAANPRKRYNGPRMK